MKNKYGKILKNIKSGKYECFLYILEQDYNKLIQNIWTFSEMCGC